MSVGSDGRRPRYREGMDSHSDTSAATPFSIDDLRHRIYVFRGERVLFDSDLAVLYGVETKAIVQAVKRNPDRFPIDFMFQLDVDEFESLRSQFVTSNSNDPAQIDILRSQTVPSSGRGGRRTPPYAFTEHGIAMLSSVLRSERAIKVNIAIIRAFIAMRRYHLDHAEITHRLDELEQRYDDQFAQVFEAIRQLMEPPTRSRRPIGFDAPDPDDPASWWPIDSGS